MENIEIKDLIYAMQAYILLVERRLDDIEMNRIGRQIFQKAEEIKLELGPVIYHYGGYENG